MSLTARSSLLRSWRRWRRVTMIWPSPTLASQSEQLSAPRLRRRSSAIRGEVWLGVFEHNDVSLFVLGCSGVGRLRGLANLGQLSCMASSRSPPSPVILCAFLTRFVSERASRTLPSSPTFTRPIRGVSRVEDSCTLIHAWVLSASKILHTNISLLEDSEHSNSAHHLSNVHHLM